MLPVTHKDFLMMPVNKQKAHFLLEVKSINLVEMLQVRIMLDLRIDSIFEVQESAKSPTADDL